MTTETTTALQVQSANNVFGNIQQFEDYQRMAKVLDYIAEQLDTDDTTSNGKAFVNYEDTDNDIVIEGSVQWQGGFVDKFMDNGHKYLDCTEYERTDFSNLQVDAWVKGEKVAVDLGYIEDKLSINL